MLRAECLLSVSGIYPTRPLTRQDGREAEKIPKTWAADVGDFLNSSKFTKFRLPPKIDHEATYDALTRGTDPAELATLTDAIADDDLRREYEALLANAREYLRARWPMLSVSTPTGPRFFVPGLTECARAASVYAVVNNPSRILVEVSMGTIVPEQVEAFDDLYPDLSKMLRGIVNGELLKGATKTGPREIPWRIESTLRILLGLPPEAPIKPVEQPPPRMVKPDIGSSFKSSERTKAETITARETGAGA